MKKAFTLIELLIVIAIIAILAGVVFVNLNSARLKARDTKVKSDMSELAKALEIMKIDKDLPTVEWSTVKDNTDDMSSITQWTDIDGTRLITALPKNPIPGRSYEIRIMSGNNFALLSRLSATNKWWCIRGGNAYEISTTVQGVAQGNCDG